MINNKNVPRIRFPGFTDAWGQRKLSEIADKAVDNRGKTPTISEDGSHPLLEVASLGNGTPDYSKVTKYLSDETFETELRAYIKKGDILFSTVGSIGLVSLMDANEDAAIAQNIVAFRANEKFDSKFLYAMLSTEDNQYKAQRIVMGAVQPSIKVSQLVDVEYCVTENIDEQRKLGVYFLNLDNLITLHQRKYEAIKDYKQGMLQKMFPKEGKNVPEIRFPGFTDAWEQRKFGDDIESIQTGTNLLGSESKNGTPLLKMGNIQRGYFDISKIERLDESDTVEPENVAYYGDFFFNTRNTMELVGKGATWLGDSGKYAFNSNIARFKFKDLDTVFFNYLYNTEDMTRQIHARATGTTSVAAIYPRALETIEYYVPSREEQSMIGELFVKIDNLITLHQRKCEELKEYKNGLLQKMFV